MNISWKPVRKVKRSKCVDKQYKRWNNWVKRQMFWKIRGTISSISKPYIKKLTNIMYHASRFYTIQWLYKEKFENIIRKRYSETINRKTNRMVTRKGTKGHIMIYKTLHIKLKTEQQESH